MTKIPSPLWLIVGVATATAVALLLSVVWEALGTFGVVWNPWICQTDALDQAWELGGYRFESSQTICSRIGKGPAEIGVFASQLPRGKNALIFKYERAPDGSRDAEPVVTLVADGTVRISVKRMEAIICRRDRWEALTIQYDIGRDFESAGSPPGNCRDD